jgi:5-oxoprolinase (ATP-hydrolysing) subunit A
MNRRLLLNIDIGERGADHPVDRALMRWADVANIACGGHAGGADSVAAFRALAERRGVLVTAHLSYPDRTHFGRLTIDIPSAKLRDALAEQLAVLPGVETVKFHGALYNDCCTDDALAAELAAWLPGAGISCVITLPGSALDGRCRRAGIRVMREAFAERRHCWSAATQRLSLVSRQHANACITDRCEARENARTIIEQGKVRVFHEDGSPLPDAALVDVDIDTICIHSDSPIAEELAGDVSELLKSGKARRAAR